MQEYIEVKSHGKIIVKQGMNERIPFNHQKEAMKCLNVINQKSSFATLIVLPTGGGKTYTLTSWLLKNAVDQKKKILWLAHRQILLDQAAESFQKYAYSENITHVKEFQYRIISGSTNHDRIIDIDPSDNILIMSKDSLGRNLEYLDQWLKEECELYVIVDEAHHSTAKTYRKIIDYVREKVPHIKLIGLTATPFRTAKEEEGLLSKIYRDGISDEGQVIHNNKGITYQIGLKELINQRILSKPIFESYYTDDDYGKDIGLNAVQKIQNLDTLPDDIAKEIAESAVRNKLIVDSYLKKKNEYRQTIVFAVNVLHAITLSKLFNKAGIKADYIVSDLVDPITGEKNTREENERKLQEYREGKIQVLTNVNILTEGVDVPSTETVFLARPTVSTILMTQMIGRALRGTAAKGTSEAHIVSFIDNWNDKIAWVNPETLFTGNNEFVDNESEFIRREIRVIALSKIEEFASILDDSIDTSRLEQIPFIKRIPVGMYAFTYLQENGMDLTYQVMVYDSTKEAYENLMRSLPELFQTYHIESEYLYNDTLTELEKQCHDTYFCGEMLPPYESKDIINVLKYFAQYSETPKFYTFEEVDRNKLDLAKLAKSIWDKDLRHSEKTKYLNDIWESNDDNILRLYFGKKIYFMKLLSIELIKIAHPDIYGDVNEKNVVYGKRNFEDLSLYEIRRINPNMEKELRDGAFKKAMNANGDYCCSLCGKTAKIRIPFQVDHIIPLNKGGKSVPDNLQVLCKSCNGKKGDK